MTLVAGTPGHRRLARLLGMMVAEALGIPSDKVRPIIARHQLARLHLPDRRLPRDLLDRHGGDRGGPAGGQAAVRAGGEDLGDPGRRGGLGGRLRQAGRRQCRRVRAAVARRDREKAGKTGGPIAGDAHLNAQGAGPGFGTHLVDVEVDKETGQVTILRYTAMQDVGKAIHPSYVEGQIQGGAVQGIGWALNEEYIYDENGRLDNPGFLDYRMPVASDVPMIDTVIVEVPNPRHPFGVRGVGEIPIVPPMAAIANAIAHAIGIRFTALPMSPPRVLKALEEANGA